MVGAQSSGPAMPGVAELARELEQARRAHLRRVLWWGAASLVAGVGLAASADDDQPTRRGFGLQTAGWGAVDVAIAAWGLRAGSDPATTPQEALEAEDAWTHVLLVNLGLNVGYVLVGTALHVASQHGLRSGASVRGHADAVIVQGAALFVLDGIAWISSRRRLEALHGLAFDGVRVGRSPLEPGAVQVGVRLRH